MPVEKIPPQKCGYPLNEWLAAAGFSRTKFYQLAPELKPRTVWLRNKDSRGPGMQIVVEAPEDYFARIAATQETV